MNAIQFPPRSLNWSIFKNFHKQVNRPPLFCSNCGGNWKPNHRGNCIAKGKTCNNCGLLILFGKVCRKQKNSKPQNPKKRKVNTVDKESHAEDSVNFLQSSKPYESNYISSEDNMVALTQNDIAKKEPLNMPMKIGNISTTLLVDSGNACTILNQSLLSRVVRNSPHVFWIHDNANPQLRTFLKEPIRIEGKVQAPVPSNGWTSDSARFTVVTEGLKSLIGRDLFDQLGIAVTKSSSFPGNQVNTSSPSSEFKEYIALKLPILLSRIRRSKDHVTESKFHKNFQPRHQNGRLIPINLQNKKLTINSKNY